jgi:hypothetical protein
MSMKTKEIIKSQYYASLEMLRQAILKCPDSLWASAEYKNPFWHTAVHAVFYAHFYLHPSENDFVPWDKQRDDVLPLGEGQDYDAGAPYSRDDVLAYLDLCLERMEELVDILDLEAESGFHWLPFDKLELQIYNIRHIMQHVGELCERLGATGDVEIGWVGKKPA